MVLGAVYYEGAIGMNGVTSNMYSYYCDVLDEGLMPR